MSTTFYIIDKEKEQRFLNQVIEAATAGKTDTVVNIVSGRDFEVEIGIRSCGWQFLWHAQNLKYFDDKESLFEWLKTGQIIDEYGQKYTFEEFMEGIEHCIYKGYNLEEWHATHPGMIRYCEKYLSIESKNGKVYQPNKFGEFFIDRLRFTVR